VPQYLVPIYEAAGARYGIRWDVLAAINEVETAFGRHLAVSSAGARGWMQFMPSTWRRFAVDANGDGRLDPNDPRDAIFSAARYLRAAGGRTDIRRALFAYNHAAWYVDLVLTRAADIRAELDPLAALAVGRFPVSGPTRFAAGQAGRKRIRILGREGATVRAVAAGTILRTGGNSRLGRSVRLRDAFGNRYTYSGLAHVKAHPDEQVHAGTVLGRVGRIPAEGDPGVWFTVRPAGRGEIDPKPVLNRWKRHGNPGAIAARVLADPRIQIYACGRDDIRAGRIDARVLVALEFLADSGLHPTVSALECGHSLMTTSGNVSEHSTGDAVDISAINGVPIAGHQGPGSITELAVRRLLTLTGAEQPHQIITLMQFPGAPNTLALPDHWNHIHIGWRPAA
jgi:murein DD-endopeptidase MepM/ murein hydrolase activator NlpD